MLTKVIIMDFSLWGILIDIEKVHSPRGRELTSSGGGGGGSWDWWILKSQRRGSFYCCG